MHSLQSRIVDMMDLTFQENQGYRLYNLNLHKNTCNIIQCNIAE